MATALRASVLRPFVAIRTELETARHSVSELEIHRRKIDSLMAVVTYSASLDEEVESLRALFDLGDRGVGKFVGVALLRTRGAGSEGMFIVNKGIDEGVTPGRPVITPDGVVGRIVQARRGSAVGIDWTHADFRASAMVESGSAYGIVWTERGTYREEDRLVLDGLPYHGDPVIGKRVLTSGLGSVYPRGIPIGVISEVRAEREPWAKTYWLTPAVKPASVLYAAVSVAGPDDDLRSLWSADSLDALADDTLGAPPSRDRTSGIRPGGNGF